MGSVKPSPANTSLSSTLKLPPSKIRELLFFSHNPRNGRPEPAVPLHSETFSASSSVCTMGTNADWFFLRVTRSLSLYSKRSPRPWPLAAASIPPMEFSTVPGLRLERDMTLRPFIPIPPPAPALKLTCARLATANLPNEPVAAEISDALVSRGTPDAVTSTLWDEDPTCSCPLIWFAPGDRFRLLTTVFRKPSRSI